MNTLRFVGIQDKGIQKVNGITVSQCEGDDEHIKVTISTKDIKIELEVDQKSSADLIGELAININDLRRFSVSNPGESNE